MEDSTSFTENLDYQGVTGTHSIFPDDETGSSQRSFQVYVLFNRYGQAMKGTLRLSVLLHVLIQLSSLLKGILKQYGSQTIGLWMLLASVRPQSCY